MNLWEWQEECFILWKDSNKENFLISSTPGAGKTIMGLKIADYCLKNNIAERVVVVVPTENLKYQWANDAFKLFDLEFTPHRMYEGNDFIGITITYQAIANNYDLQRKLCYDKKTIVIFDEIHHAGDSKSWGESIQKGFEFATKRILLSGTPFRTDKTRIPFVEYKQVDNNSFECISDYSYDYTTGIIDGKLKELTFTHIDGLANFTKNNMIYEDIRLSDKETDYILSLKKKSIFYLDCKNLNNWYIDILTKANDKLNEIRNYDEGRPDAAGIIFVNNINFARYFEMNKKIHKILGCVPVVVHSDKTDSIKEIEKFKISNSKWIVCVNQVSEGVDIKRLCVGVYASNESTDLIFRQRVARIIRMDQNYKLNKDAYFFLPDTNDLRELSKAIEKEVDMAVMDENYIKDTRESYGERVFNDDFMLLGINNVEIGCIVKNGKEYKASKEEIEQLKQSIPGLSNEQSYMIVNYFNNENKEYVSQKKEKEFFKKIIEKKDELNKLVEKIARNEHKNENKTTGEMRKKIYNDLISITGKTAKEREMQDIEKGIEYLKRRLQNG